MTYACWHLDEGEKSETTMSDYGFDLIREATIRELQTRARLYRHRATGAQLLSLENDDENKVFGITFRTPPPDSTGIAHILEHSVLGGSRKYPLKEPFVQLVKGSLKTFLNAMTYPDRTVYPVASTNLKDFYNLVDVYLDAVLHPLITRHHLDQEGWHYELESADAPLRYRGVVFNEMKGAYSSPDNLLYRTSQQSLFPDTVYGYDSGGDPSVIPELTYEQFTRFHRTYYHPSNALIYFYGDDDPEARLRLVESYLSEFSAQPVNGEIALQPVFSAPRRLTRPYSVDAGSDAASKAMVQLNWLLPEGDDLVLVMGLSVLSYALVSTQASPLRKALMDSGLGEDVTGGGLNTTLRQMTFHAGLKGVEMGRDVEVEALILDTLARLAQEGIDPEMVEAAYNTIEFSLRENNTGSTPRGLALMMRSLRTWVYGGDPIAPLAFEEPLAAVRRLLDTDPTYLQRMIRIYLLENPHRTTVVLAPDPTLGQVLAAEEQAKLARVQAQLDAGQIQEIIENTHLLRRLQETPDPPEVLAKLPSLKLGDLDREVKTIPLAVGELQGAQVLTHDLFTNGIVYLDLGFNLQVLPPELLPYAKLFGQSLVEMGTEREDYVKLAQRIGRVTGGIYPSNLLSSKLDDPAGIAWLLVHGKATLAQGPAMVDILREILLTVKLDNRERFRQIVLKNKARSEASLAPAGHSVVDGRLRAGFTTSSWAGEQMGGVDYLAFLRKLATDIDQDWPGVLAKLEEVRRRVVTRAGMLVNVTLDEASWRAFEPALRELVAALPAHPAAETPWTPSFYQGHEGLVMPAQVNYVGKGANLYALGYQLHGSIHVITNLLRTGYLWEKIRVQGGAYGAFCRFSQQSGVLTYLSYRDPNLLNTLAVYNGAGAFLRQVELSDDELTKGIIGAISILDAYQLPDAKGYTSMVRYLLGESDEHRQQIRDEVLGTTAAHIRQFADVLDAVAAQGRVVVLGSQEALAAANREQGDFLTLQRVM
ncbi:MAG TPA: insulinase family protein [Caldilineaceae bacterium]|nr:insulinase family protein [Caldilineaceae bacterium]